jgi:hypothetical protein
VRYALVLNDMRSPNVENVAVVRLADTREELVAWYAEQLAPEPYRDETWGKAFLRGSDLEWMNPVHDLALENDYWGGIWTVPDHITVGTRLVKA